MYWNYLILSFTIVQFFLYLRHVSTSNEPQVAFFCGRPSKVLKNNQWSLDFQQNCIKDEAKVVQFCQKSFPLLKIRTAEPAIQKVKFKHWCNFSNQSCEVDVEIRPFKCLDKNFQSDALVLPRNCKFGHLFNNSQCLIYKHWAKKASEQCTKKQDWIIMSYGMLFPCTKPMFFKGVEFVCCPQYEPKDTADSDVDVYKNYLNNAVLETEQGEQKFYEDAEKRLVQSENEKESKIIDAFKESENDLEKLWKTDPENAKKKEKNLFSDFKTAYSSIQNQFADNKEQLLNYHDDRLEFIFNTKLEATRRNLEEVLKKSDKTESEIFESMKAVLTVLMDRKRYLMAELLEARKIRTNTGDRIYKRMQMIDKLISDLFDKLKQIPDLQLTLKQKLMNYFTNIYPDINEPIEMKNSIYDDNKRQKYQDIIAKYRHSSRNPNSKKNGFSVHYDLGLDDPDQLHVDFSRFEEISHNVNRAKLFIGKPLLGIIFGVLLTMVLLLLIVFGFILRQKRLKNRGYSNPKHQNEESRRINNGFGANNSCHVSKTNKPTFYENLTYSVTFDQPLKTKIENSNLENEENSQISINS